MTRAICAGLDAATSPPSWSLEIESQSCCRRCWAHDQYEVSVSVGFCGPLTWPISCTTSSAAGSAPPASSCGRNGRNSW